MMKNPTARSRHLGATLMCWLAFLPAIAAQEVWSDEQLETRMAGFKKGKTLDALQTLASLVQEQKAGFLAICNRIHGDHAEYLLRIEKLLDELSNDRWEIREKAEKTLEEIGAKGRERIETRIKSGETLEERIRADRALTAINAKSDSKEQMEKQYLMGLGLTALYMDPAPKLIKALVSALRHPHTVVVDNCARALGAHGGDAEATKLIALLSTDEATHGETVRAALARMEGTIGRDFVVGVIKDGKVGETEALQLLRILRERPDGAETLPKLAGVPNKAVATAAALKMPAVEGQPRKVRISLADQTVVEGLLTGYVGDSLRLTNPVVVQGKDRHEIPIAALTFPMRHCDGITFIGAKAPETTEKCRLYLVQGTLVTCDLLAIDESQIVVTSATFGRMEVPRAMVQGIALDPKLDRLLGGSSTHDKVRLRSNQLLAGRIEKLDGGALEFKDDKGQAQKVPVSDLAGLLFKRPLQTAADNRTFTRVALNSGDKILGHIAGIHTSHVGIVAPGVGAAVVPMEQIVGMEFSMGGGAMWGFTLVADYSDNRIVEFDDQGREVFSIEEIFGVWDVECLENGNLLITEFSVNRVSEVTRKNKVVWSFEELKNPYDADRLPNGNTLIADTFGRRVIEVNPAGKIVWSYDKDIHPYDVDRLPNGNTLIADTHEDRVIEVNPQGKIVWQIKNVPNVHDADRLPNGNTLLTIRMLNEVREVDPSGKTVFTLKDLSSPSDADRLPNGNTLVAENGFIREFDRHGNEVWRKPITWAVEVNRY